MTLRLSDAEIDELCEPLTQPAAQARFLRKHFAELPVRFRANGRLLILRQDFENLQRRESQPSTAGEQPDIGALLKRITRRPREAA